jgi:hypothetical protein
MTGSDGASATAAAAPASGRRPACVSSTAIANSCRGTARASRRIRWTISDTSRRDLGSKLRYRVATGSP